MSTNPPVLHLAPPGVPGGVSVSAEKVDGGKILFRISAGPFTRRAEVDAVDAEKFAEYLAGIAFAARCEK